MDKIQYQRMTATKIREARDKLKASGLWDDKTIENIWLGRALFGIKSEDILVGLSTYSAGELLGVNYKNIQSYCNSGKMKSVRDILDCRVIPVEEVIKWKISHQ